MAGVSEILQPPSSTAFNFIHIKQLHQHQPNQHEFNSTNKFGNLGLHEN
jgi:hypothetical protein